MKMLQKRIFKISFTHFCVKKNLEFAKKLLKVARMKNLISIVKQAALIKRFQKKNAIHRILFVREEEIDENV
jgi:hypothetical protein